MPDRHFTALTGDRVVLRRFAMADVATFVAYRSDPDVARYQSWEAPYPRAAGERMIRRIAARVPGHARAVVPVRDGAARDRRTDR